MPLPPHEGAAASLAALVSAVGGFDITPSDDANDNFTTFTRAIHVGTAGTVSVLHVDNTTASYTCVAGEILPVQAKRVNSAGTNATGLTGMY